MKNLSFSLPRANMRAVISGKWSRDDRILNRNNGCENL